MSRVVSEVQTSSKKQIESVQSLSKQVRVILKILKNLPGFWGKNIQTNLTWLSRGRPKGHGNPKPKLKQSRLVGNGDACWMREFQPSKIRDLWRYIYIDRCFKLKFRNNISNWRHHRSSTSPQMPRKSPSFSSSLFFFHICFFVGSVSLWYSSWYPATSNSLNRWSCLWWINWTRLWHDRLQRPTLSGPAKGRQAW